MASLSTCPNCKREFIANAKGQYCPECWSAWSRNDGTYERREKSGLVLAGEAVKVKPLEWRDHPHAFPAPTWSAKTPFGFYNLEEISASDSPAYEVRLHAHHLVAITDSLDAAKAAAQVDYDQRIRSTLVAPQPDWFSQVVSFFVKNDMLDERDEYDIGDVMAALQDNYDPAQPVEAQEPVALWGWVIPRGGKKKPVILDAANHDEISAITEEEIHGLGYFPVYAAPSPVGNEEEVSAHPDDLAVDRFAAAMKAKLAEKRAQGYGGWDNPEDCSIAWLSNLLRKHINKGDPVDVGNFAMMIHQRGGSIE